MVATPLLSFLLIFAGGLALALTDTARLSGIPVFVTVPLLLLIGGILWRSRRPALFTPWWIATLATFLALLLTHDVSSGYLLSVRTEVACLVLIAIAYSLLSRFTLVIYDVFFLVALNWVLIDGLNDHGLALTGTGILLCISFLRFWRLRPSHSVQELGFISGFVTWWLVLLNLTARVSPAPIFIFRYLVGLTCLFYLASHVTLKIPDALEGLRARIRWVSSHAGVVLIGVTTFKEPASWLVGAANAPMRVAMLMAGGYLFIKKPAPLLRAWFAICFLVAASQLGLAAVALTSLLIAGFLALTQEKNHARSA